MSVGRLLACTAALVAACSGTASVAQTTEVPTERSVPRKVVTDLKAYVTAPIHAHRAQWIRFGAALGTITVAYRRDEDARDHFLDPSSETLGPNTHDGRDAVPAALLLGGTWGAAMLLDSDDGRAEAGAMLEAAAFSAGASALLKKATRRERPYISGEQGAFGENGDSFPSMHTAVAFAIGATLAESGSDRHRLVRRVLGYGVAAGTAYARMKHDAHWLSDTVAGGALGIATARFVAKQRDRDNGRGQFAVVPTPGGVELTYSLALR